MSQIASYSQAANAASNPDLGGYSLFSLPPGYDASGIDLSGYSIPNVAGPQLFDFGSNSYGPQIDLASYIDSSYNNPGIAVDSVDLGDISIGG